MGTEDQYDKTLQRFAKYLSHHGGGWFHNETLPTISIEEMLEKDMFIITPRESVYFSATQAYDEFKAYLYNLKLADIAPKDISFLKVFTKTSGKTNTIHSIKDISEDEFALVEFLKEGSKIQLFDVEDPKIFKYVEIRKSVFPIESNLFDVSKIASLDTFEENNVLALFHKGEVKLSIPFNVYTNLELLADQIFAKIMMIEAESLSREAFISQQELSSLYNVDDFEKLEEKNSTPKQDSPQPQTPPEE